jgi:hypothetical protein
MASFYAQHVVPINRIPRAIIVNRKYIITFTQYNILGATIDTQFEPSLLKAGRCEELNRGYPLFWLLYEVHKGITWLDGMYLDYGAYYQEAYT